MCLDHTEGAAGEFVSDQKLQRGHQCYPYEGSSSYCCVSKSDV